MNNILKYIGIFALLVLCFFVGRKSVVVPQVTTKTKWDTVRIETPVPYKVDSIRTEYVTVYVPSETLEPDTIYRCDTIRLPVNVEQRIYGDDRYRAVVSGAVIGDIRPSLDGIEIYQKTETRFVEKDAPLFRPYVSASIGKDIFGLGGGVSIKNNFDLGVKYLRIDSKNKLMVEGSIRF